MFNDYIKICDTVNLAIHNLTLAEFIVCMGGICDQYCADTGTETDALNDALRDLITLREQVVPDIGLPEPRIYR